MKMIVLLRALVTAGLILNVYAATPSSKTDVTIENANLRLVLSSDGYAKSLIAKATGTECLMPHVRVPFATLTQNRPYDNEYKLMLPAKPWTHRANRIERIGDELKIGFEDEFDVAVIRLHLTDSYVGFELVRIDYGFEDIGFKRRTEIDALSLVRLPLIRQPHFGRILNVTWNDATAVALIAGRCATRVDADEREDGGLLFWAGTEEKVGLNNFSAVLVATPTTAFLDAIDQIENDYNLPRGVSSRRRADVGEPAYFAADFTLETLDYHIEKAREGGFKLLLFDLGDVVESVGTYQPKKCYPRGLDDFARLTQRVHAAGLDLAIHGFSTKAHIKDPYVSGGKPDPRFNVVTSFVLATNVSEQATTLVVEGNRNLLRFENGRRLLRLDNELVFFGGITEETAEGHFAFTNCTRAALCSIAAPHAQGTRAFHLDVDDWPIWVRLNQDTALPTEIAERMAAIWTAFDARMFYFDGAEDVPEPYWYYVPKAQLVLYNRLQPVPHYCESALKSHFGWHINARGNAFDVFPPERLRAAIQKYVIRSAVQDADDFSRVDFGWLNMRPPERVLPKINSKKEGFYKSVDHVNRGIGMQMDHFEYAFSKAFAYDCPITVQFASRQMKKHPHLADNLAVMRRWSQVRRAGKVDPNIRRALQDGTRDFLLLNDDPLNPEIIACHPVTTDDERPIRAFSFTRGTEAGIIYWNLFDALTPSINCGIPQATESLRDGRRVLLAPLTEAELVRRFRARINANQDTVKLRP